MGAKKILKRIAIAIAALIVVCITASFFALRSRAFHRYALAVMVRRAEQATGGRVQIGDFTFHLSGLRVDLYRVAIHGTEPDPTRPLLWVDHAGVKLEIVSLLERKLRLRAVEIDHPVVHLMVSTDGHSNLPQPPPSKRPGKLANTLFSLAIDHFGLHRGDIDFNDRQIPLEAELRHLQVQTDFDAPKTEYDGSLAYSAGEVQAGKLKPLPHSLVLRFSANPGGLRASPLCGPGVLRFLSRPHSRTTVIPPWTAPIRPRFRLPRQRERSTAQRFLGARLTPAAFLLTRALRNARCWTRYL